MGWWKPKLSLEGMAQLADCVPSTESPGQSSVPRTLGMVGGTVGRTDKRSRPVWTTNILSFLFSRQGFSVSTE